MRAPVPTGFRERREGSSSLVYDPAFEADLEHLGLLDPDALEQRIREAPSRPGSGPGVAGRAPTLVLTLRDGSRLLVRALWRGGVRAPLVGRRLGGPARPLYELWVTRTLRERSAPVPRPAFAWARCTGLLYDGGVATVLIEDTRDGLDFLEQAPSPARVRAAAAAMGRAVRAFHDAGGSHPDLHVKNLLLREPSNESMVVDLDRVRLRPTLPASARMAQLMRLYRSLVKRSVLDRVGARGIASFFAAYVQEDRVLRRALLERLPRERLRLALHAWRY